MKLTNKQLKKIIKEEVELVQEEQLLNEAIGVGSILTILKVILGSWVTVIGASQVVPLMAALIGGPLWIVCMAITICFLPAHALVVLVGSIDELDGALNRLEQGISREEDEKKLGRKRGIAGFRQEIERDNLTLAQKFSLGMMDGAAFIATLPIKIFFGLLKMVAMAIKNNASKCKSSFQKLVKQVVIPRMNDMINDGTKLLKEEFGGNEKEKPKKEKEK